jgi:hypothetical protein
MLQTTKQFKESYKKIKEDIINSIHQFLTDNNLEEIQFNNGIIYMEGNVYDDQFFDTIVSLTNNSDIDKMEVTVASETNDFNIILSDLDIFYLLTFHEMIENNSFIPNSIIEK